MITINISKLLVDKDSTDYKEKIHSIELENKEKVVNSALDKISLNKNFTSNDVKKHLRTIVLASLGANLSSFLRRDIKCDPKNELRDSIELLNEWILLRKNHGIKKEHPSIYAFQAYILALQWKFSEAAPKFEKAANLNMTKNNKYPCLPNFFNASYCYTHLNEFEKAKNTLSKLDDSIRIIKKDPKWKEKYKEQSISHFKEFDIDMWSYLGWCDYFIHQPDWNTNESIEASFEAKWGYLIRRYNTTQLTVDLAVSIFTDKHWAKIRPDITNRLWKTIYVDMAKNRVKKVARVFNLFIGNQKITYDSLNKVASILLATTLFYYAENISFIPTKNQMQQNPTPVVLFINDLQTTNQLAIKENDNIKNMALEIIDNANWIEVEKTLNDDFKKFNSEQFEVVTVGAGDQDMSEA